MFPIYYDRQQNKNCCNRSNKDSFTNHKLLPSSKMVAHLGLYMNSTPTNLASVTLLS